MLFQGILLGISLSLMIGPLLFAIVQAGLERGFRAGMAVAVGIWISDFVLLALLYFGMDALSALTALPGFRFWAGLCGAALLLLFGLGAWISSGKPPDVQAGLDAFRSRNSYSGYGLRGFLLNTVNPFTLFFWIGIGGAFVVPNSGDVRAIVLFFSGMFGALMAADVLKAWGAKKLRQMLEPALILKIRRTIGLVLIGFGVALASRTL
jgi:threonine/homoserine/homoserine lactone efflux protein